MKKKARAQAKVVCGRQFSEMRKTIAIIAYTLNATVTILTRVLTLAPFSQPL